MSSHYLSSDKPTPGYWLGGLGASSPLPSRVSAAGADSVATDGCCVIPDITFRCYIPVCLQATSLLPSRHHRHGSGCCISPHGSAPPIITGDAAAIAGAKAFSAVPASTTAAAACDIAFAAEAVDAPALVFVDGTTRSTAASAVAAAIAATIAAVAGAAAFSKAASSAATAVAGNTATAAEASDGAGAAAAVARLFDCLLFPR